MEQIKHYRSAIGDTMSTVKTQLDRLSANITDAMDKITSREKYLNSNLDSLLMEYRMKQVQIEF